MPHKAWGLLHTLDASRNPSTWKTARFWADGTLAVLQLPEATDGALRFERWNKKTGALKETHTVNFITEEGLLLVLSNDQSLTAEVSDRIVTLRETRTGQPIHVFRCRGLSSYRDTTISEPIWVCFSEDNRRMLSVAVEGTARVWDIETGDMLADVPCYKYLQSRVVFSPDAKYLLLTMKDGPAILLDATTGTQLHKFEGSSEEEHFQYWVVSHANFSPDGSLVSTLGRVGTARLWDTSTGMLLHQFNEICVPGDNIQSFSPDGRLFATTNFEGCVYLWNTTTGELHHALEGHERYIYNIVFSPDGTMVATASSDHTIMLWNAETGERCTVLFDCSDAGSEIQFSPDGRFLVSRGIWDCKLRLWGEVESAGPEEMPYEFEPFFWQEWKYRMK